MSGTDPNLINLALGSFERQGVLYTLTPDGRTAQPARGKAWALWYLTAERRVRQTRVGSMLFSTVFLGINLLPGPGAPELWETTLFTPDGVTVAARYATYDDAVRGHGELVRCAIVDHGSAPEDVFDAT